MQDHKKISIIIMTYNRQSLLNKCLNSLFNQDYPKNKYEILIVDDASTDNTKNFIKTLQKKHKNLLYIKHSKNKGIAASRNTGIKNAKHEIICFVADDYILPVNYLVKINEFFNKYPNEKIISFESRSTNNANFWMKLNQLYNIYQNADSRQAFVKSASISVEGASAIKKSLFKKIGMFNERFRVSEDIDMGYRIRSQNINIFRSTNTYIQHTYRANFLDSLKQKFLWGASAYKLNKFHKGYLNRLPNNIAITIKYLIRIFLNCYTQIKQVQSFFKSIIYLPFLFCLNLAWTLGVFYGYYFGK